MDPAGWVCKAFRLKQCLLFSLDSCRTQTEFSQRRWTCRAGGGLGSTLVCDYEEQLQTILPLEVVKYTQRSEVEDQSMTNNPEKTWTLTRCQYLFWPCITLSADSTGYLVSHQLCNILVFVCTSRSWTAGEFHILNIATNEPLRALQKKTWNMIIMNSFSSSWTALQKLSSSREAGNHMWFVWTCLMVYSYVNERFRKGRRNWQSAGLKHAGGVVFSQEAILRLFTA